MSDSARSGLILVDRRADGTAQIVLTDRERRNALSNELLGELAEAFTQLEADPSVLCIVLASSDPATFSAGGDLAAMAADATPVERYDTTAPYRNLLVAIASSTTPVLCAASGHVLAGALGLALACDLIIAREGATFGTPEINVGVFPFQVLALLYRKLPRNVATELVLTGERLTAERAHNLGLVNRVVPDAEFDATVDDVAATLASKSPLLMRMGKEAMARQRDMPLEDALEYLQHRLVIALGSEDIREGVDAFFSKRDAVWKGR
jgi:enoyl-CoA hydratase